MMTTCAPNYSIICSLTECFRVPFPNPKLRIATERCIIHTQSASVWWFPPRIVLCATNRFVLSYCFVLSSFFRNIPLNIRFLGLFFCKFSFGYQCSTTKQMINHLRNGTDVATLQHSTPHTPYTHTHSHEKHI